MCVVGVLLNLLEFGYEGGVGEEGVGFGVVGKFLNELRVFEYVIKFIYGIIIYIVYEVLVCGICIVC